MNFDVKIKVHSIFRIFKMLKMQLSPLNMQSILSFFVNNDNLCIEFYQLKIFYKRKDKSNEERCKKINASKVGKKNW